MRWGRWAVSSTPSIPVPPYCNSPKARAKFYFSLCLLHIEGTMNIRAVSKLQTHVFVA